MMSNRIPKAFRVYRNGKVHLAFQEMPTILFHAWGKRPKLVLLQMGKRWAITSITEVLGGSDTYAPAHMGGHKTYKGTERIKGTNHWFSMRMAYDPDYNDLHDLFACKCCGCPNFDLATLNEKAHLTCPRCQTDPELTEEAARNVHDEQMSGDEFVAEDHAQSQ